MPQAYNLGIWEVEVGSGVQVHPWLYKEFEASLNNKIVYQNKGTE